MYSEQTPERDPQVKCPVITKGETWCCTAQRGYVHILESSLCNPAIFPNVAAPMKHPKAPFYISISLLALAVTKDS